MTKLPLILSGIILLLSACSSVKITNETDYSILIPNPKSLLTKEQLIKDKEALRNYHPNPFNSFPETEWDSLIEVVAKELPLLPIRETEKTLIRRKLLDRMTYEDPHLRFVPFLGKKEGLKIKVKQVRALPFTLIHISDTLIIDESFHQDLNKGDRILSINGISAHSFLESSYRDRYMLGYTLQTFHHFIFSPTYKINLTRNNKPIEIEIPGFKLNAGNQYLLRGQIEEKIFDDYKTGYFSINEFSFNGYIIKRLSKFIDTVKEKGYSNIVIDIRKNRGGSGDRFDELFSLFTNKEKLPYLSGSKLKVSKATYKDYSYSEEDFCKLVELPDSLIVKECPLDLSKYKGDMNYYTLISKNTGSIASSFANIMQYNDLGKLVGEPLAHNALNYGEVITAERDNSFWTISTVENFEYTKAENGILRPDISIPFVAAEYMKGGDPVLEKLLKMIKSKK